jgi:ubiquinone/menaquinone biosynthesis C-methylase UbiE
LPSYEDVIQRLIPEIEYHQNRYARGLAAVVPPRCRWLDVGAGTRLHNGWIGAKPGELAERTELLVGCDFVETHLAKNSLLDVATVADAANLPFSDGYFDLVTANMVLEHLEEPERVFLEVARVLAPGGRFVFVTPNLNNPVVRAASIALSRPVRKRLAHFMDGRAGEHIFHTFYRANSRSAIEHLCGSLPLTIQELDTFNSIPFNRRYWGLTVLESLWIKGISQGPLRAITTNLYGVLKKEARQN